MGLVLVPGGIAISLDSLEEAKPVSDYAEPKEPKEVKIRKSKKKKNRTIRQRDEDDDDIFGNQPSNSNKDNGPDITTGDVGVKNGKYTYDISNDDEDLQAKLAQSRLKAIKERKKRRPEDIIREIKEEEENGMQDVEESEPGLVLDETSEFIANLRPEERQVKQPAHGKQTKSPSDNSDDEADDKGDIVMKDTFDEEEAQQMIQAQQEAASKEAERTATGLVEESTLNQGLAATLNMLNQRGLMEKGEGEDMNKYFRERQRFLADKQNAEAEAERRAREQRERDRRSGRLDNMSARDREEQARFNNVQRDQLESRKMADIFNKEYKPNVDIKYTDEFGRSMNQKEAFKHLSHQFHGKGSGKGKTEKRLKKIDDEKKREAMSSLDSSQHTGMNSARGATARKNRQAGVRLQ